MNKKTDIPAVKGERVKKYINKPIGFGSHDALQGYGSGSFTAHFNEFFNRDCPFSTSRSKIDGNMGLGTLLLQWRHNTAKRKIGLVLDTCEDGGYKVAILSDERVANCEPYGMGFYEHSVMTYVQESYSQLVDPYHYVLTSDISLLPSNVRMHDNVGQTIDYDKTHDYKPKFLEYPQGLRLTLGGFIWQKADQPFIPTGYKGENDNRFYQFTTNPNTTIIFGEKISYESLMVPNYFCGNPLKVLSGDIYNYMEIQQLGLKVSMPKQFDLDPDHPDSFKVTVSPFEVVDETNLCAIPYNIILTENAQQAQRYLTDGTIPDDAFLYPLDWSDLPRFVSTEDEDDDTDDGGDTGYNNNDRDIDPMPLEPPMISPQFASNQNFYWLGVGEYGQFLNWFWNDIDNFSILDPSTWDNLIDNIKGLYNDLAQTIIAVRYMPIDPNWVCGLAEQKQPIKLGMIEDDHTHYIFNVKQINNESAGTGLLPRDLGEIDIDMYTLSNNTFLDVSPYSELVLYLPFYGYVNLDIDLFNGHNLSVKGLYDILSGTLMYFIYLDHTALVNYYMAKICVDIPVTLQTAYDRNSSVLENITSYAASTAGFLASAYTASPIGMTLSASQLVEGGKSTAPIVTHGFGSEQGILYSPSKCTIILRRPTVVKHGDAYKQTIGFPWCRTSKLNNPALNGLVVCYYPRIHFNGVEYVDEEGHATGIMILPLAEEIEEIYDLLEKGVIV